MNELTLGNIIFLSLTEIGLIYYEIKSFKKLFEIFGDIEDYLLNKSSNRIWARIIFLLINAGVITWLGGRIVYWLIKHTTIG
jgi:hypothetical protein